MHARSKRQLWNAVTFVHSRLELYWTCLLHSQLYGIETNPCENGNNVIIRKICVPNWLYFGVGVMMKRIRYDPRDNNFSCIRWDVQLRDLFIYSILCSFFHDREIGIGNSCEIHPKKKGNLFGMKNLCEYFTSVNFFSFSFVSRGARLVYFVYYVQMVGGNKK